MGVDSIGGEFVDAESTEVEVEKLRHQVFHSERMAEERAISDAKYAPMLVKTIVYGLVALILVGVMTAMIALVVK